MCGIFGYIGNKNSAPEIVLEGLKQLEYRGYDSWGLIYVKPKLKAQTRLPARQDPKLKIIKRIGKIGDAVIDNAQSSMALGHTRWATHGGATIKNAHPHLDCKKQIAIVHNGIIENYQDLRRNLKKKGHKFISETDTETAVHHIEELFKKNLTPLEAVRSTFLKLKGRNAIIAFFPEQNQIIAVKNGTPIVIGKKGKEYFISSDAAGLLPHTKTVHFLEDNFIVCLSCKNINMRRISTLKKEKIKWEKLDWKIEQADKGLYKYYYIKEIMDQIKTIKKTVLQDEKTLRGFADLIRKSYGTYFIGAGTSYYSSLAASYIFSKVAKKHINYIPASEYPYTQEFIRPDSLIIGVSQSGETADLLEAVDKAKKRGAIIGAIVNNTESSLARTSELILPLMVGPERAVLATKSFTSSLICMYLLAYAIKGEYKQGKETMLLLAKNVKKYLNNKQNHKNIKAVAQKIFRHKHIFCLGRGVSFPIALEAALKIKESSYIHAEGFAGGELKHGVIALVEKNTPFLVFVPNDETKDDIISNIMEVKARGAKIIGVSPQKYNIFDMWIEVPDVGITNPIMSIIPIQLLAYYLTIGLGLDPDKPRNLAKSVTVK